ncbi:hypothetical protein G3I60_11720 [Streptomyces sp. SID13666]|uniref:hypothetical protein n=1 Tax=unclassified Streptomyces TaxID=2593676 RepID=UPI0013C01DF4|nr:MULTISPECIES: hypothetical protein [unclassified Streptomyces]NEA54794.1 hypothetical protein [Streptomyces sp. SID13666]NEA70585.1 hypothetical protein [Streptomyces sp. SID13588]
MAMDVRDKWDLNQSNGFTLHMEIAEEDDDGFFSGRANIHGQAGFHDLTDARATDDEFTFLMGSGRYVGRFDFQGRLTGSTFDTAHPSSQATFFADKEFGRI